MATFTIVLVQSAGNYTFSYTPSLDVKYAPQYNTSAEPPTLGAIEETWRIYDAVLIGATADALWTDWSSIRTKLISRATPITGVLFKKDGSTIDEISTTTHTKFRILELNLEPSPGKYTNHLKLSMTVVGLMGLANPAGGDYLNVTQLEMKLAYEYSPEGLLTKRLSGVVRTKDATAEARARVIGVITLPSDKYRYLTKGPEGVNVTVEDQGAGTQASFECAIQEQALSIPAGCNQFSRTQRIQREKFKTTTTVTVTAQAATLAVALAAVEAQRPTKGFFSEEIEKDEVTNTVTGVFVKVTGNISSKIVEYTHRFSRSGGDASIEAIEIPGGDADPVLVHTSKKPLVIKEWITVRAVGDPSNAKIPKPVWTVNHDKSLDEDNIESAPKTLNADSDEYVRSASRTYKFASDKDIPMSNMLTALSIRDNSTLQESW